MSKEKYTYPCELRPLTAHDIRHLNHLNKRTFNQEGADFEVNVYPFMMEAITELLVEGTELFCISNTPNSDRDLLAAFKFASSLFSCGTVHTFCLSSKSHNAGCKCGLYVPLAIRGSEVAREYMALVNARSMDTERLEALEAEMNKEFTRRNVFKWIRELR